MPEKGSKRQRTRELLIQAAAESILEKGYDRTTLEEVARRAGMTRGAIYGNFQSREDLLLAVAQKHWDPMTPNLKAGAPLKDQMRLLAEALVAEIPSRQKSAVAAASFQVYALTHDELKSHLDKQNRKIYEWAEKELTQFVPEEDLPMRAAEFVRVVHALTEGLLALRFLTPDLFPDELIISAFEALAGPQPVRKRS
jgi:AcrR family transcriptional regulator